MGLVLVLLIACIFFVGLWFVLRVFWLTAVGLDGLLGLVFLGGFGCWFFVGVLVAFIGIVNVVCSVGLVMVVFVVSL